MPSRTPCWHPVPSGTLCQHPQGHCACRDPVPAPCILRDPAPVPTQDLAHTGTYVSTLHLRGPRSSMLGDTPPEVTPCQHLASSGTLCQHPRRTLHPQGPMLAPTQDSVPSALQLWEPCTCGCPTATHLREVTGQPVAVAGACGGPQGEVEGPELAGSYSLRGDVELAGGTVPEGHPAAGKLGRGQEG